MSALFAAGENYSIELEGEHVVARVWRRPDLDSASGARNANEMTAHLKVLTETKRKSLILDLREAPPVAGPKTIETMTELLRGCERAGVRIAVVLSNDPLQLLQFRRLVSSHAPTKGRVAVQIPEAKSWVSTTRHSRP